MTAPATPNRPTVFDLLTRYRAELAGPTIARTDKATAEDQLQALTADVLRARTLRLLLQKKRSCQSTYRLPCRTIYHLKCSVPGSQKPKPP